jgi:hypothetical protein
MLDDLGRRRRGDGSGRPGFDPQLLEETYEPRAASTDSFESELRNRLNLDEWNS